MSFPVRGVMAVARDGELSGWVVRVRAERRTRGWDVPMMARRLRAALGDGDGPSAT
ncbi:hypothetical protein ACFQVD_06055 [Streptosporangium amethystogenes subsp. fukuiense]|uniref:Uncharacterized protein n=1 Tax=Streptosporangium amethystogenes subsp. fukuiense TaxID=698418 RepID=A0ABW2STS1_9ACTN